MIVGFNRDLAFRLIGPTSSIVQLTATLTYASPDVGGYYAIPEGFECDLASVPKWLAALAPPWQQSARSGVLHDAAYRTRGFGVSRKRADALLREALILDGVDRFRAWAMYRAVRVFGRDSYHARALDWRHAA